MKKFMKPVSAILLAAVFAGCLRMPYAPMESKEKIISDLISRREAIKSMEADIKFHFPGGIFFSAGLDAHAVYKLEEKGPLVRLVAFGPMGVQALDLLVRNGDFLIKVPDNDKPMGPAELKAAYGEGLITRIATLLAKRPGLFFGGIPEDLNLEWESRTERGGMWLEAPDGSAFYVAGSPPVLRKTVFKEGDTNAFTMELGNWRDDNGPLIPLKATIKFDKKSLFDFKIIDYHIGPDLPPDVFIMSARMPRHRCNSLKIKMF